MPETLDTLGFKLEFLNTETTALSAKVTRIDEAIRGNGEQGLKRDLLMVQRSVEELNEFREGARRLSFVIVVGVVGLLLNFAWSVLINWKQVVG